MEESVPDPDHILGEGKSPDKEKVGEADPTKHMVGGRKRKIRELQKTDDYPSDKDREERRQSRQPTPVSGSSREVEHKEGQAKI